MTTLTHEQKKGNILREYDGFVRLAAIDRDLCIDVAAGAIGRSNGGDYNKARVDAETAVATVEMLSEAKFGYANAAKAAQAYFQPAPNNIAEPEDADHITIEFIDDEE